MNEYSSQHNRIIAYNFAILAIEVWLESANKASYPQAPEEDPSYSFFFQILKLLVKEKKELGDDPQLEECFRVGQIAVDGIRRYIEAFRDQRQHQPTHSYFCACWEVIEMHLNNLANEAAIPTQKLEGPSSPGQG